MNLYKKIKYKLNSFFFFKNIGKKININTSYDLKYFGSPYGGWYVFDTYLDSQSVIVSCGVGEDISFDVELLKKFNCYIHLFDPTPRSIKHYEEMIKYDYDKSFSNYSRSGKQEFSSYKLNGIDLRKFIFHDKAVWNKDDKIKFFSPPNKYHVSYSINNYQNYYKKNTDYILVSSINFPKYLSKIGLKSLDLLKLDIEGAEIEVIDALLNSDIKIKQICVEFDELHLLTKDSKNKMINTYQKLISSNYICINIDKGVNYTFLLKQY